jgi:hypothetical protein
MAVIARLGPNGQRFALQGQGARQARPDDFLPRDRNKPDRKAAELAFRAIVGEPMVQRLGGAFDDMLETSLDVMAGRSGAWDAAKFKSSVNVVFGATQRPDGAVAGGLGTVRGRTVELPDTLTASEFDRALSRADFGAARYANGQPASKLDVLSNYQPVPLDARGTRYMFLDGQQRPLSVADGNRFVLTVAR